MGACEFNDLFISYWFAGAFDARKSPAIGFNNPGPWSASVSSTCEVLLCRRIQYTHTPPKRGPFPLPPSLPPPLGLPLLVGLILACLTPSQTPL